MAIRNVFGIFGKVFGFLSAGNLMSDILALTVVALVLGGIYMTGRFHSDISCAEKKSAGIEKTVKDHGKVKRQSYRMDKSELDSYLSGFLRN